MMFAPAAPKRDTPSNSGGGGSGLRGSLWEDGAQPRPGGGGRPPSHAQHWGDLGLKLKEVRRTLCVTLAKLALDPAEPWFPPLSNRGNSLSSSSRWD